MLEIKLLLRRSNAYSSLQDFEKSKADLDKILILEPQHPEAAQKLKVIQKRLDEVTPEHCILASNTSSIPLINLGTATKRPERVLGLHFFNPATVQKLCEIVVSIATDDAVVVACEKFAQNTLGKETIRSKDRAGFIVNALLFPYLNNAIRMLEQGTANMADIDTAMKGGCNFPMGPFALLDLVGLDTSVSILDALYAEFKDENIVPAKTLRTLLAEGKLGRKTKQGFFSY